MAIVVRVSRAQLVNSRKIKSSPAYQFGKGVRTFFVQNKLGKTEADYFKHSLKILRNENEALLALKRFVKNNHPSERAAIVADEFDLMRSLSFRLDPGTTPKPLRTQPKKS